MFNASPLNRRRRGFSLIELMVVVAIILVILMITVPRVDKAMKEAREMAAIQEIKTIHVAQTQYYSHFGRYAQNLRELGPPAGGTDGPAGADLLPPSLSGGKKGGHIFTLATTPTGYSVTVVPEHFGTDGSRTFYSDQTTVVHENRTAEPATVQSPIIGAQSAPITAADVAPADAK